MRHYLALLLCVLAALAATACKPKKPTCDATVKYADAAAAQLAPVLGCANPGAMSKSLVTELEKANLCSAAPKAGPLASIVCAPLVSYLASLPAKQLPADWQCTGGSAQAAGEQVLLAACEKINF